MPITILTTKECRKFSLFRYDINSYFPHLAKLFANVNFWPCPPLSISCWFYLIQWHIPAPELRPKSKAFSDYAHSYRSTKYYLCSVINQTQVQYYVLLFKWSLTQMSCQCIFTNEMWSRFLKRNAPKIGFKCIKAFPGSLWTSRLEKCYRRKKVSRSVYYQNYEWILNRFNIRWWGGGAKPLISFFPWKSCTFGKERTALGWLGFAGLLSVALVSQSIEKNCWLILNVKSVSFISTCNHV